MNRLSSRMYLCGCLVAALVWSTAAAPAYAASYYVDPAGSDSAGDGSATGPWASLSHACSQVSGGTHTIHLGAGTYVDDARCVLAPGVSIQGAGRDLVTIESSHSDWFIYADSSDLTAGDHELSGFTLDGNGRALEHGLWFFKRSNVHIHDCRFRQIRDRAINIAGAFTTDSAPTDYVSNILIHDSEFLSCASHSHADNSFGAIHLNATEDVEIYNLTMDESATTGQCIKGVYGWNRRLNLHDNTFQVGTYGATNACVIEIWNLMDESEIHHNEFNNGFVSLVSGDPEGGAYALSFHHNVLNDTLSNEFSMDDLRVHHNVLTGNAYVDDRQIACWSCIAVWTTWIHSADEIHNVLIHHNVIYDAWNAGIFINDQNDGSATYSGFEIFNNTIDGTAQRNWGGHGIVLNNHGASWTDFQIRNNLILNSEGYAISAVADRSTIVDIEATHNGSHQNGAGDVDLDGTTNLVLADNFNEAPGMVGTGARPVPYYLPVDESSNLVDRGVDVGLPFVGAAPDIGAYEHGQADAGAPDAETPTPDGGSPDDGGSASDAQPAADGGADPTSDDSGCGCRGAATESPCSALLALGLLLMLLRRRIRA